MLDLLILSINQVIFFNPNRAKARLGSVVNSTILMGLTLLIIIILLVSYAYTCANLVTIF